MLLLTPYELADEQRKEYRIETPDFKFLTATFRVGNDLCTKEYELPVLNFSRHGLGLLVAGIYHSLVQILYPGYLIIGIRVFAERALTIVDGTVRHMTRIESGEKNGDFILGLESSTALEFEKWDLETEEG